MNNNKKFLIVFLVVLLLGVSLVVAEDNNDIGTQDVNETNFTVDYEGYVNETHNFNKSDNTSLPGFCLDSEKDGPGLASNFTVSKNSSSVDSRIKELIAKYFRYNNTQFDNRKIKEAIWAITNNRTPFYDYDEVMGMIDGLTGVAIGDIHTFVEDGIEYTFNFFFATPNGGINNSNIQNLIVFNYTADEIPGNNTTNNTTSPPGNNTTTNNTPDPEPNTTVPEPETPIIDVPTITPPEEVEKSIPIVKAGAKKAGLPILVLIILMSSLGLIYKRRK